MKLWIRFGLYNAIVGLLFGAYLTFTAPGGEFQVFIYSVPLAVFLTAGLFWRFIVGDQATPTTGRVIVTGVLTGTVSHYVTFVIVGVFMNICHWVTGGCTGSLGDPPAGILSMLTGALGFSFFSLLWFGWLSVGASVLIGLALKRARQP